MEKEKKMNVKIIIPVVIVAIIIIIVVMALSNKKSLDVNSEKGSRDNPYLIGDEIKLSGLYNIYDSKAKDLTFDLSLKVNKELSTSEGTRVLTSQGYDTYTYIPIAEITFKLEGKYDDSIAIGNIFNIRTVNENFENGYSSFVSNKAELKSEIYTGKEYTYYATRQYDKNSTNPEILYLLIEYKLKDNSTQKVYIKLETDEKTKDENPNTGMTTSKEEKIYNSANNAKEKGYYTIAKNLYSKVLDYKDSKNNYDNVINLLKEYNGTYYGESTDRKGVYYNIFIKDGEVRVQLKDSTSNTSKYELYSYGTDKTTGNPILAFSDARTSLFEVANDTKYGDGYAIQKLADGSYLVAATEGSSYTTFNGFYEKISDTVENEEVFN